MLPLVKRLTACLQGESLEIQGHLALELAATVDFSGDFQLSSPVIPSLYAAICVVGVARRDA